MAQQILEFSPKTIGEPTLPSGKPLYGLGGMDEYWARREFAKQYGFMSEKNGQLVKSFKIRNIYDMIRVDYPHLFDDGFMSQFSKDAPLLSTTTGAYQAVHGASAVSWVIQEDNALRLLGLTPWNVGGFRGLTEAGKTSGGGVAEGSTIPNTTKPTLVNVDVPIKEEANTFDVSSRQEFYSRLGNDDVWNEGGSSFIAQRNYHAMEHNKLINRQILTDNNTLAGDNAESLDRIIASKSEIDGVGQDAGDLDIYGLDRDSVTTNDAYVAHNSGTDRNLTTALLKDVIVNTQPFWGGPGTALPAGDDRNVFWLSGYDTKAEVDKLFESQNTYRNLGVKVNITLNGVQTLPSGSEAGFLVNSVYGYPWFSSNDVAKDTISRIYLINGNHLTWKSGILPQFFSAGMGKGTPLELGKFTDEGMFYQAGEVWADRFNVHGKIRDLQSTT